MKNLENKKKVALLISGLAFFVFSSLQCAAQTNNEEYGILAIEQTGRDDFLYFKGPKDECMAMCDELNRKLKKLDRELKELDRELSQLTGGNRNGASVQETMNQYVQHAENAAHDENTKYNPLLVRDAIPEDEKDKLEYHLLVEKRKNLVADRKRLPDHYEVINLSDYSYLLITDKEYEQVAANYVRTRYLGKSIDYNDFVNEYNDFVNENYSNLYDTHNYEEDDDDFKRFSNKLWETINSNFAKYLTPKQYDYLGKEYINDWLSFRRNYNDVGKARDDFSKEKYSEIRRKLYLDTNITKYENDRIIFKDKFRNALQKEYDKTQP